MDSDVPCCSVEGILRLLRLRSAPKYYSSSKSKNRLLPNRGSTSPDIFYNIEKQIGEGAFGQVYLVVRKKTGTEHVLKTMRRDAIPDQAAFDNELGIQMTCDHPHICRIFDTFEQNEEVHIVLEVCVGGSLEDSISSGVTFGEAEAHCLMRQLLSAITYMHARCLVHRDLKPDNMLLSRKDLPILKNSLKLVDFGFAKVFTKGVKSLETKCGTLHFMAPEILEEDYFDEKCDVWSSGIILYMFLCGAPPFDDDDDDVLLEKAAAGKLNFEDPIWASFSAKAKLAIVQMCKVDPERRLTAEAALHSPWMMIDFGEAQEPTCDTKQIAEGIRRFRRMTKARKAAAYLVAVNITDAQQNQVALIRHKFEELDTNGDGFLSLEEIRAGLGSLGMSGEIMFEAMDLKHNKSIEWSEFLSMMVDQRIDGEDPIMSSEEMLWAAFKVLDQDNTKSLTVAEIFDVMSRIDTSLTLEDAKVFVQEADSNGDGEVDFEEFMGICSKVQVGSVATLLTPPPSPTDMLPTTSGKGRARLGIRTEKLDVDSFGDEGMSATRSFKPTNLFQVSSPRNLNIVASAGRFKSLRMPDGDIGANSGGRFKSRVMPGTEKFKSRVVLNADERR